jgi:hypothetical protein
MNELQAARSKWLEAQRRLIERDAEVARLQMENFELRSQLISVQTQFVVAQTTAHAFAAALFA